MSYGIQLTGPGIGWWWMQSASSDQGSTDRHPHGQPGGFSTTSRRRVTLSTTWPFGGGGSAWVDGAARPAGAWPRASGRMASPASGGDLADERGHVGLVNLDEPVADALGRELAVSDP